MNSTLILALLLFLLLVISTYSAYKRMSLVLAIFLFVLLFHELFIRLFQNELGFSASEVRFVSLWKEAVLGGLILAAIWKYARRWRKLISEIGNIPFLIGTLMVAWGIISVAISPDRLAGLAAFRDYYEPLVILGLVLFAKPKEHELRRYIHIWLIIGAGMALLGIWQGAFWGEQEYVMYGFGQPISEAGMPTVVLDGQTIYRPVSTVTGPNELGFHMVLLSIFTLKHLVLGRKKSRVCGVILFIVFSTCLFYTRSRSDLLAYGITVGLVLIMSFRGFGLLYRRNPIWWWSAALTCVLLITALLYATGMVPFVLSTVRNLRSEYHVIDITEAIVFLAANPGGVGMGLAGPRIGAFFPETPAFHAEGSLFQIALDMSVFGLLLWLAFVLSLIISMFRRLRSTEHQFLNSIQLTAITGWVGGLFVFLILPLMQSMTLMSWMWFLLGIGVNAKMLENTRGDPAAS